MPTINELIRNDPERMSDYVERRKTVFTEIVDMGFGAQARAAREIGVSPSYVSLVLNAKVISESTLQLLEDWLEKQK